MGLTKTELFTEEQNQLAQVAKALAHPARIAILQHLVKSSDCICNDLVSELRLAQATISQHLKELKQIGLIQGTIEGTSMCYCINAERWESVKKSLVQLFDQYQQTKPEDCC